MSIKIEKTEVFGWEAAIRGCRNSYNSWNKSDSGQESIYGIAFRFKVGENDLKLMKSLSKAGDDHAKFLRMINVTCDITAPLYWWKEFDTYKVGTVANSCSTMHKIHAKEFTFDDFSHEKLINSACMEIQEQYIRISPIQSLATTIECLNSYRDLYLKTKDKKYWWQMIQLLPSSYNQKRTVQLNYQVLKNMYFARKGHRLDEWKALRQWMETLPYFREVVIQNDCEV